VVAPQDEDEDWDYDQSQDNSDMMLSGYNGMMMGDETQSQDDGNGRSHDDANTSRYNRNVEEGDESYSSLLNQLSKKEAQVLSLTNKVDDLQECLNESERMRKQVINEDWGGQSVVNVLKSVRSDANSSNMLSVVKQTVTSNLRMYDTLKLLEQSVEGLKVFDNGECDIIDTSDDNGKIEYVEALVRSLARRVKENGSVANKVSIGDLDLLRHSNQQLKDRTISLESQLDQLRSENQQLSEKLSSNQSESSQLQSQLDQLRGENQQLNVKLSSNQSESSQLQEMQSQLDQLRGENQQLSEKLSSNQSESLQLQEMQSQLDQLRGENQQLNVKLSSNQSES
jgi:epidermal growth factor receptor substrate 15